VRKSIGTLLPVDSGCIGAHHFLADLTLPYGRVAFDYNRREFVGRDIQAVVNE